VGDKERIAELAIKFPLLSLAKSTRLLDPSIVRNTLFSSNGKRRRCRGE
jgi:hypothetical protein